MGFAPLHICENVWSSHEGKRKFLKEVELGLRSHFGEIPPLKFTSRLADVLITATFNKSEQNFYPIPAVIREAIDHAVELLANEVKMIIRRKEMSVNGHRALPMRPTQSESLQRQEGLMYPSLRSKRYGDFIAEQYRLQE